MPLLGKGYSSALEANKPPIAIITPGEQEAVIGSIVKLDGRASHDPDGDELTYEWKFTQIPIGSQVEKSGFIDLESDSSVVSFAPDVLGIYKIQLIVFDTNNLASEPFIGQIDTRIILVPYHQGFCPDASFIWNYLSDFWTKVDGRRQFETFWEGAIQITAGELLKTYQYDYNKSIKDIQHVIQKRWINYNSAIALDDTTVSFILADDHSGGGAESVELDAATGIPTSPQPHFTRYIGVPKTQGNLEVQTNGLEILTDRVITFGDRAFSITRINHVFKFVVHNSDGGLATATSNLTSVIGTFNVGMVGHAVHILSGVNIGLSTTIIAFISSSAVTLDVPAWAATETNVEFSVVPNVATHNAIFTSETNVTTGLKNKFWRISATLLSSSIDFGESGVSSGDVLEVEVTRTDVDLTSKFNAQVIGVDRSHLGFVLNINDLVQGVPAEGVSKDDQIKLATELQIPGLFIAEDRSLVYADQAGLIYNTVRSLKFKRTYFEKVLTPTTEIDVGAFKITVRPIQVIRNKRIPIDTTVASIPVLQEYICQPDVSELEDGKFLLQTMGGTKEADRAPIVVLENLDYIVDDESTIRGFCNTISGNDIVEIPFGDLIDRSVHGGDVISIEISGRDIDFTVSQVIDIEHLRIIPSSSATGTNLKFQLKRKIVGKHIRFIPGVFNPKNPCPTRLWSEVTYFDNNPNIENNFGVLVGIKVEDIEKVNATTPYKSAVAGLMYALTTGPTVDNIRLSAQILLGLPFTQNSGVITEINPTYKLHDNGSPEIGRILVEARDSDDKPLGITNIYLYPRGRQIPDPDIVGAWLDAIPEFQGIAINPDTGISYAVGDHVPQFVPLTKGVNVQEYITQPRWFDGLIGANNRGLPLEIYHSFNLIINSDLVTTADIDIAAAFIKKAKPTYTKLKSVLLKSVEDEIDVEDDVQFTIIIKMFEQESASLPIALKVDKFDIDESFTQMSTMLDKYIEGDDIQTVKDSDVVTSSSGGFINARFAFSENHDIPYLRFGDLLVIHNGPNAGTYTILAVPSDSTLQVDLVNPAVINFETITPPLDPLLSPRQLFTIYRPIRNPIWWGDFTVIISTDVVTAMGGGLVSAGVAVGDVIVFKTQNSPPLWGRQYIVKHITTTFPGDQNIQVDRNVTEASGVYNGAIVREALVEQFFRIGEHASFTGANIAAFAAASPLITLSAGGSPLVVAQVLPGDIVTTGLRSFTVLRNEGASGKLRLNENAGFTDAAAAISLERPSRGLFPITVDLYDRIPKEYFDLTLTLSASVVNNGLVTSTGSPNVSTALSDDFIDRGVLIGDYVQILSGADSTVDTGHGPGIYLIQKFSGVSTLVLANNLTATHGSPGVSYAIIRKRPNEG